MVGWREHSPGVAAERPDFPGSDLVHRRTGSDEPLDHGLVGGPPGRPHQNALGHSVHDLDRADVVVIEVGEHEQVDALDAEGVETALQERSIPPRIDERDLAAVPHEQRVALAHVALRDAPLGGALQ